MGLRRIALRDFVLVDAVELDLGSGFTVLTGETGAGKSILIDALQLAAGARGDPSCIREGCERTEVTAEFDVTPEVSAWLMEQGMDTDGAVLLRRVLDAQGRSRAWINGSAATVGQLRTLGEMLIDIHGQHAWHSLTRPSAVRALLDAYAGCDTATLTQTWQSWQQAREVLQQALQQREARQVERERLQWQIHEVEPLAPGAQEWDSLNAEHSQLANAQGLLEAAHGALVELDDGDVNARKSVAHAIALLQNKEQLAPNLRALADELRSCLAQLEDATHGLRTYLRHNGPDPRRLSELDERLSRWVGLARRLRVQPADLSERLQDWRAQLLALDAASDVVALQSAEADARAAFMVQAQGVSQARQEAAGRLTERVSTNMQTLGMEGGRFEVIVTPLSEPQSHGVDEIEFRVTAHAGGTPRPVAKVASGGELSRLALAIAVCTSELGNAPTLIFDEVDAGIGGTVGQTVGALMRRLGRDRQVLTVTHLAQVAVCADTHVLVRKEHVQGATRSAVLALDASMRVTEVARMLGGDAGAASAQAHARDMLSKETA